MAKKRKPPPTDPPHEKDPSGNEDELTLLAQKEINATLDMIIRNYQPSETDSTDSCSDDEDCCDKETEKTDPCEDSEDEDNGNNSTCKDDTSNKNGKKKKPGFFFPPTPGLDLFLTCVDIFIFELDEEVVEKLILCAIVSMSLDNFLNHFKFTFLPIVSPLIRSIETQLNDRVANVYNQFLLQVMTGIQTADSKKDYIKNLFQSNMSNNCKSQNLADLLTANLQNIFSGKATNDTQCLNNQLDQLIRGAALTFLFNTFSFKLAEFQRAVGLKIACVEADLTFLSTEILRFTSLEAGILQTANALVLVASARFAEEKNYDEIFDAVEKLADVIEDLADIYRDRLRVLRVLLPFSTCPRPVICPDRVTEAINETIIE